MAGYGNAVAVGQTAANYGAEYLQQQKEEEAERASYQDGYEQQAEGSVGGSALAGAASGAAMGTMIMPGWGTAIGGVVGGAAGAITASVKNEDIRHDNELSKVEYEGNKFLWDNYDPNESSNKNVAIVANGGSLKGNKMNGFTEYTTGGTHEQNPNGGILVDDNGTPAIQSEKSPVALVEAGELAYDDYVYSNRLKDGRTSFARKAKAIRNRYSFREEDPISKDAMEGELLSLMKKQEASKNEDNANNRIPIMGEGGRFGKGYSDDDLNKRLGASVYNSLSENYGGFDYNGWRAKWDNRKDVGYDVNNSDMRGVQTEMMNMGFYDGLYDEGTPSSTIIDGKFGDKTNEAYSKYSAAMKSNVSNASSKPSTINTIEGLENPIPATGEYIDLNEMTRAQSRPEGSEVAIAESLPFGGFDTARKNLTPEARPLGSVNGGVEDIPIMQRPQNEFSLRPNEDEFSLSPNGEGVPYAQPKPPVPLEINGGTDLPVISNNQHETFLNKSQQFVDDGNAQEGNNDPEFNDYFKDGKDRYRGSAAAGMGAAGYEYMTAKTDSRHYGRLRPELVDYTKERTAAKSEAATTSNILSDEVGKRASSGGNAMTNIIAGNTAARGNLGKQLGASWEKEINENTGIINQAASVNQKVGIMEMDNNYGDRRRVEEQKLSGVVNMANQYQGYMKDANQYAKDKELNNFAGTANYGSFTAPNGQKYPIFKNTKTGKSYYNDDNGKQITIG